MNKIIHSFKLTFTYNCIWQKLSCLSRHVWPCFSDLIFFISIFDTQFSVFTGFLFLTRSDFTNFSISQDLQKIICLHRVRSTKNLQRYQFGINFSSENRQKSLQICPFLKIAIPHYFCNQLAFGHCVHSFLSYSLFCWEKNKLDLRLLRANFHANNSISSLRFHPSPQSKKWFWQGSVK